VVQANFSHWNTFWQIVCPCTVQLEICFSDLSFLGTSQQLVVGQRAVPCSAVHWNRHPAVKSFPRTFEDGVAWYSPFRSAAVWTKSDYRTALTLRRMCLSLIFEGYSTVWLCCHSIFRTVLPVVHAVYAKMTATKTYVALYHYILMTGRQTFFTGRQKCRPFTMLKNTLALHTFNKTKKTKQFIICIDKLKM